MILLEQMFPGRRTPCLEKGGMGEMFGVMLVEGHALFRQALAVVLNREGLRVVAQAGSLAEARERTAALEDLIRVAVVELTLPDGDGMDLVRELRLSSPDAKVMVLAASTDPETATRALEAGASVMLHKSTAGKDEIVAAVRVLLKA